MILCNRRITQCNYPQKAEENGILQYLHERLNQLANSVNDRDQMISRRQIPSVPSPRSIDYKPQCPIPSRWYYPMLLHFSKSSTVESLGVPLLWKTYCSSQLVYYFVT